MSDQKILNQVERFASSDSEAWRNAWEILKGLDRRDLIATLQRISDSLPTDDRQRVFIAFLLCRLNENYDANRRLLLSALTRESPFRNFHGDWAVSLVRRLMVASDKRLVGDLFAAADWSDGAMSDELADAYSDSIRDDPQTFLLELSDQRKETQQRVYRLLEVNSLTEDEMQKAISFFQSISQRSTMHSTAQEVRRSLLRSQRTP